MALWYLYWPATTAHTHHRYHPPQVLRWHCMCQSSYGPQSSPWVLCGTFAKGLEPPVRPTAAHLALNHWIWFSTTQHWSVNHLSSSAWSSNLEHTRRNGSIQHRTSHTMMTMWWWWWCLSAFCHQSPEFLAAGGVKGRSPLEKGVVGSEAEHFYFSDSHPLHPQLVILGTISKTIVFLSRPLNATSELFSSF